MSGLVRLSISLEQGLAERLDALAEGGQNRSELVRALIRARLAEDAFDGDAEAIGTVTLVYDHHQPRLAERLTEVQHAHHSRVLATTHVHLDHDLCAEMIMIRGRVAQVRALAEALRQQKGVLHAALALSATGREGGHAHAHSHDHGHHGHDHDHDHVAVKDVKAVKNVKNVRGRRPR